MSRTVITIDYDEDKDELTVDRQNDPVISEATPEKDIHPAAIYGAIAYEAIDQATEAKCVSCAGDAVLNLSHIADQIHFGKDALAQQAPDESPTKH